MMRLIAGVLAILLGAIEAATAAAWLASSRTPVQPRPDGSAPKRGSMHDPAMAKVPVWVRGLLSLAGLAIVAAGILLILESNLWLWSYVPGWLIIQAIAIYNGFIAFGRPRWSHHVVRFVVFGSVFGLALWATR